MFGFFYCSVTEGCWHQVLSDEQSVASRILVEIMECVKEINFHIFHDDIQSYLHVLVVDSRKPLCKRYSKGHGQPLAHTVLHFLNAWKCSSCFRCSPCENTIDPHCAKYMLTFVSLSFAQTMVSEVVQWNRYVIDVG